WLIAARDLHVVKPPWIAHGQRPQQYCIHHAEHRCVRPDAERPRDHRYGSESRTLPQLPHRVSQILYQSVHTNLTRISAPPWDPPLPPAARECNWPTALTSPTEPLPAKARSPRSTRRSAASTSRPGTSSKLFRDSRPTPFGYPPHSSVAPPRMQLRRTTRLPRAKSPAVRKSWRATPSGALSSANL